MTDIYIHVGLARTATTWLQEELFSKLNNVNYIAKTKNNYPQWLINWHYLDDYAFDKNIEDIKFNLNKNINKNQVNILSSEAFTNMSVKYSQAKRIKKIAPNAKIIITLRDPIDLIKSHYKFHIKEGLYFLELDKYLDWKRTPYVLFKRKPFYLPDLFYDEIIEYYQRLFGKENILILKYEDMINNPELYFSKLSEFIGIRIDYKNFQLSKKVNEGSNKNIAELKFLNFKNFLKSNMNIDINKLSLKNNQFNFTDTIMSYELRKKLEQYFKGKCFGYY